MDIGTREPECIQRPPQRRIGLATKLQGSANPCLAGRGALTGVFGGEHPSPIGVFGRLGRASPCRLIRRLRNPNVFVQRLLRHAPWQN